MAKLTFVLEDGQEVVVPLTERVTIGRAEDCDVVVDDERISAQHAELLQNADGSIQVFDLNSGSGTFVNGARQKSCTLLHGDQLAFGPLSGRLDMEDMGAPAQSFRDDKAYVAEMARMEAEKARLKAAVDAVAQELRDWEKRAEKERAMHLARIESLRAEEGQLAPLQAAMRDAESTHRGWLEAVGVLSVQHQDKTTAMAGLELRYAEKSAEVERLAAEAATATQEVEALTARLKQVRDECEQDENLLNSLRQQIIELEVNVKEEEARQSALTVSGTDLVRKKQKDEEAVRDLESLLMKLEQQGAAAEGALQRRQEELSACESDLSARRKELADETRRLEETKASRAEMERQCLEFADVKQQLADARQRLAAVEQRLQSAPAEEAGSSLRLAAIGREPAPADAPVADGLEARHQEITRQVEAARQELGDLQSRINVLRNARTPSPPASFAGKSADAQEAASIPAPVIVQVVPVRLAPVMMKSERARAGGARSAGTKSRKT